MQTIPFNYYIYHQDFMRAYEYNYIEEIARLNLQVSELRYQIKELESKNSKTIAISNNIIDSPPDNDHLRLATMKRTNHISKNSAKLTALLNNLNNILIQEANGIIDENIKKYKLTLLGDIIKRCQMKNFSFACSDITGSNFFNKDIEEKLNNFKEQHNSNKFNEYNKVLSELESVNCIEFVQYILKKNFKYLDFDMLIYSEINNKDSYNVLCMLYELKKIINKSNYVSEDANAIKLKRILLSAIVKKCLLNKYEREYKTNHFNSKDLNYIRLVDELVELKSVEEIIDRLVLNFKDFILK